MHTSKESTAAVDVLALVRDLQPPFLAGLSRAELCAVVGAADCCRFDANSVILSQGCPARKVVLLIAGEARSTFTTLDGERLLLRWMRPGEVIGIAALLPPRDYFLSTEAVKESCGLVWEAAVLRRLATRYSAMWENAFAIVSHALGGYIAVHVSQMRHSAPQRLARVLVDLAEAIGHSTPAGIELNVRNEDLANAANVTPFTASRLLNQWQRSGVIAKSRGKIVVRTLEGLFLRQA